MLCDKCGKNIATTHIKEIINGYLKESNLCDECAAKMGHSGFSGFDFGDMLTSFLGSSAFSGSTVKSRCCPTCGASFEDISNSGRLGCADCYNAFKNELLPYIKRVHGTVKHTGKRPQAVLSDTEAAESQIDILRAELSGLIAEERFEDAAVVRDKIKELEAKENE